MSVHDKDNELMFESYISKQKQINEASYEDDGYKITEFQTYNAWKRAVKKLDPDAKFTGDKDIDSYKGKKFHADWDGAKGTIETKIVKENTNYKESKASPDGIDYKEVSYLGQTLINLSKIGIHGQGASRIPFDKLPDDLIRLANNIKEATKDFSYN